MWMAYVKALHPPQLATCFTGDATPGLSAQAGATLGLTNVIRSLPEGGRFTTARRPPKQRRGNVSLQTLGGQSMVAEHWQTTGQRDG